MISYFENLVPSTFLTSTIDSIVQNINVNIQNLKIYIEVFEFLSDELISFLELELNWLTKFN